MTTEAGPYSQPETTSAGQVTTQQQQTAVPSSTISNGDLPWAQVLLPTTSSGVGGVGQNAHQLQPGSWVFGFFADGEDCQQPVIVGVFAGGVGTSTGSSMTTGQNGEVLPVTAGGNNVDRVYRKLRDMGYTHIQACGIIGNLQTESTVNINPGINNPNDRGAQSYGIAQWQKGRLIMLRKYAAEKKVPINDLEMQLEFLDYEMKNYPSTTGWAARHLQNATTPEDAAAAFANFEKPFGWKNYGPGRDGSRGIKTLKIRQSYAKGIDQRFKSSGVPQPAWGK